MAGATLNQKIESRLPKKNLVSSTPGIQIRKTDIIETRKINKFKTTRTKTNMGTQSQVSLFESSLT